jgi:TonB family protein
MIASPEKWQGQVVDAKFVLGEYLGGSKNAAVFLTQHGDKNPQKAVIKLTAADAASADRQLSLWRRVAQLSHPNLVPLLQFDRCKFQNNDMLYAVMEAQEENLSQILPQRPLTPPEARGMLEPVLGVLTYLHAQGLVHGRLKPANILATGDQIKLSCDSLSPIGGSHNATEEKTAYDPPESPKARISAAGDVWSLGVTLVEALTLRVLTLETAEHILPDSLPSPFLEIARHSLRIDPARRWSIAEIAACLNPNSAKSAPPPAPATSAAPPAATSATSPKTPLVVSSSKTSAAQIPVVQGVATVVASATSSPVATLAAPPSPLAVPLSPVPPLPREQMSREADARSHPSSSHEKSSSSSRYLIFGAAVAVVLIAIFVGPKILSRRNGTPPATSAVAPEEHAKPIAQPSAGPSATPAAVPVQPSQMKTSTPSASSSLKTASEKESIAKEEPASMGTPPAAPPVSASPNNTDSSATRGEVLDQVLPEVSEKARATIHGKVRLVVRVHVDSSGNVSSAELDSPGPSKFFADLALQAARRWEFQSPEADGHSLPSEWLLRFEFTPTDTKVFPQQVP